MKNIILFMGILALYSYLFVSPQANARPISYPGGWTSMLMNNGDVHSLHLHYTPDPKYSIGLRSEYRRGADYMLNSLQMNNLLKRWNNKASQANLYLKSGIGLAYSDSGDFENETSLAGFTGIAADWENRRFFTSYENRYIEAGEIDDRFIQTARVGVAPYIGNHGDLHTWLMLEVEHEPEDKNNFTVTPLIRLFKGVHLVETGISNQGDIMFNWVIRY